MTTCTLPESTVSHQAPTLPKPSKRHPMNLIPLPGDRPAEEFPDDAPFGLLTVRPTTAFRPGHFRDGLPSSTQGIPGGISPDLAVTINSSKWSAGATRWAVVADNASIHLIYVRGYERPTHPDALPRECEPVYGSRDEAREIAYRRNAERMQVAIVPAEWTIVVRNLRNPRFNGSDDGVTLPHAVVDLLPELPDYLRLKASGKPGELLAQLWRNFTFSVGDSPARQVIAALEEIAEDILQAADRMKTAAEVSESLIGADTDQHDAE